VPCVVEDLRLVELLVGKADPATIGKLEDM
jgi:hypothetical protein